MCSVAVARLEGVETACKEERVFEEAVVEVVVYKVPQLGVNARGRW